MCAPKASTLIVLLSVHSHQTPDKSMPGGPAACVIKSLLSPLRGTEKACAAPKLTPRNRISCDPIQAPLAFLEGSGRDSTALHPPKAKSSQLPLLSWALSLESGEYRWESSTSALICHGQSVFEQAWFHIYKWDYANQDINLDRELGEEKDKITGPEVSNASK